MATKNTCTIVAVLVMALIIVTPIIVWAVGASMISDQSGIIFQHIWGGGRVGTGVAVDSLGNIYVTDETSSFGPGNLSARTAVFLLKYDPTGTLVWQRIWSGNGSGDDYPSAVAVDSSGIAVPGTGLRMLLWIPPAASM